MELKLINTGYFKLDGGAMFGVVPKVLWNKHNPADTKNLCAWAMRSLIIKLGNRAILVDNGIGDKQTNKFFSYYYLHGNDSLEKGLKSADLGLSEITDAFLTHLHFDHCGGGVKREEGKLIPTFSNATYWSNQEHWKWAMEPNTREKPSFLTENIKPIQEAEQLKFLDRSSKDNNIPFDVIFANGHTEKQMLPKIHYKGNILVFMADLIPSVAHISMSYIMSYDVRPLITMSEKKSFLNEAANNGYILILQHDPVNECCTVKQGSNGVVIVDKVLKLSDL